VSRDLLPLTRSAPVYFCDAKSVQYVQAAERLELAYWLDSDEIAERFGTGSYGAVGWACHGVAARMNSDARFSDRVDSIRRNCQQKT